MSKSAKQQAEAQGQADVWDEDVDEDQSMRPGPQSSYLNSSQNEISEYDIEGMDQSNILKGDKLRHAQPQSANRYNEGPDEDDLPER
ncbi:hypothetical protein N7462_007951 [Penicillium macrosclerotiorum]|uniref:uncharacterized protein n=1 Tax=Penicillium macrosclerotiorum TaxID=303699 RepID=UPI002548F370|nr:uncharacterized protein N7462_007951 [Penicillium macrosclerotiorum]KAJ5679707.1 hypothetical protein N7462_007951 [Penicillium macrosclerotiorum]